MCFFLNTNRSCLIYLKKSHVLFVHQERYTTIYVHAIELMRAKGSLAHDEKTEKSFPNDYVGQFGTISG